VLRPSERSAAGYRSYSADDDRRLARICRYRQAGLPLAAIRGLLDSADADLADVLAARLGALDRELRELRAQQRFILAYLNGDRPLEGEPFLTGTRFVELLEFAGVTAEQRTRLHAAFERVSGEEHQAFLEFLCLPDDAIAHIRRAASGATGPAGRATPGEFNVRASGRPRGRRPAPR